jgi:hypothetical protein
MNFFCVGVMYSGEYDTCDVTLSILWHIFQVCPVWMHTQSNITSINNYEVNEYLLPYIFFTLNPIDTYSVSVFASNRRRQ